MAEPIRVMVPSPGRRTAGTLRQAQGAQSGVLLLEDGGATSPLARAACAEVALYLHAAGLNTLSLRLPAGAGNGTRASQIIGGVRVLRALNEGRIVLITTASPRPLSAAEARSAALFSVVDIAARHSQSLPDVLHIVRELTLAIRDVADSVVGVAMISTPPRPPRARPTRHPRRTRTFVPTPPAHPDTPAGAHPDNGTATAPAALLLPLPPADDTTGSPHLQAQIVSRLYIWSLSLAQAGTTNVLPLPSPALSHPPQTAQRKMVATHLAQADRADWRARLRWADEQWEIALAALALRDPTRGARARAVARLAGLTRGYSLRAARLAWQHLDDSGRKSWLGICSALFQQATPYPAASSDTPSIPVDHAPESGAVTSDS